MRTLLLAGLTVTPVPFARGTRARVWLRCVRVGPPSGPAVPRPWGGAVCRRFGRPRPEQGSAVSRAPGAGSLGWHSCSARGAGYPPVPRVHTGSPVEPRARGQTAGGDRAGSPASWAPPVGALWVLCPSDRALQAVRRQVSWCVDRHRWPVPGQTRRLSSASRHSRSPVSACRTRRDISAEIAIVPRPLDGCAGPPLGTPCPAGGVADPAASSRGPRGAWTRI